MNLQSSICRFIGAAVICAVPASYALAQSARGADSSPQTTSQSHPAGEAAPKTAGSGSEAPKAAVFNFQFANLGQQPPTAADHARLPHLSDLLRELLAKSGRYQIVSTEPVRAAAQNNDLRSCGGCAETYAKKLGAQYAITGQIQKVSNLILNINVYIKKLDSKQPEQGYSVDIRGDNDVSFDRGVKYLVKNNILKE